jgi:hypothetical protein
MLVFSGESEDLRRVNRIACERGFLCAAYVRAMFSTAHDAANCDVFKAESIDLVGIVIRGAKKEVDSN